MTQRFPAPDPSRADAHAEEQVRWAVGLVTTVRGVRGQFDIAPSRQTPVYFENASAEDRRRFEASAPAVRRLASISDVTWLAPDAAPPQSAAAAVGQMTVHIPMAGLIDVDAELERIAKRQGKLRQELDKANGKLGNDKFVRNAPAEVVNQERERLEAFKRELAQLAEQRERVASLR
jgi:valyl-tRNA synthetase